MRGELQKNIAYHLKKLGNKLHFITKVGDNEWVQNLKRLMEDNAVTTNFFQTDETR